MSAPGPASAAKAEAAPKPAAASARTSQTQGTRRTHKPPLHVQRKCACGAPAAPGSPFGGKCDECARKKLAVQKKPGDLSVSEPGDSFEREADRAADSVMSGRGFALGGHDAPIRLSRVAEAGALDAAQAPAGIGAVLSAPGRPLDRATRAFFEPRFGHDFSRVRIHDDDAADRSARALSAEAYALGAHLVFAAGRYAPGRDAGRRLLAHELAHVIQQAGAARRQQSSDASAGAPASAPASAPSSVMRQATAQREATPQASAEAPAAPCDQQTERPAIDRAFGIARRWLDRAIGGIDANAKSQNDPTFTITADPETEQALHEHFKIGSISPLAPRLRANLAALRGGIAQPSAYDCPGANGCFGQDASVDPRGGPMTFCRPFFDSDAEHQASTVIHELAHVYATLSGPNDKAVDRALRAQRAYSVLSPEEAINNADSYANFARQVGTHRSPGAAAPVDDIRNCSADFGVDAPAMVRKAVARAEQWNLNAIDTLSRKPNELGLFAPQLNKYLGGSDQARVDYIRNEIYSKVGYRLTSALQFECTSDCDAGVFGYFRYFLLYKAPTLHLCKAWFKDAATDDTRVGSLYSLMLGRYGGVSEGDASRYVGFARELAEIRLPAAIRTSSAAGPSKPAAGQPETGPETTPAETDEAAKKELENAL